MTNLVKSQIQIDEVYAELEYYKTKNHKQEGEIARLQTQIQRLESLNKKLQENIGLNGKNVNNTSISFFLPSEFTILWEKLIKTELLEALDSYIENFVLIAHMAQDIMLVTYMKTDILIKSKIDLILKRLNIKEVSQEQKNKLLVKFQSFFQEHFAEIFILDKELITKIKEDLRKMSSSYKFKWNKELFKEEIAKPQFDKMIMSVFKVCLYMLLHEPILTLDIRDYHERKLDYLFFNKKEFINIEGFGSEKTPCVIILPPPMLRKKYPYSDLKAAVYSLHESNEEIMSECEKNQKEIKKPRSLGHTPIVSKIDTSNEKYNNTESPIAPKMSTVTKSISTKLGLLENITPIAILKDKAISNHKMQTPSTSAPGIPMPTPHTTGTTTTTNAKKDNEDIKFKRNNDQSSSVMKSNTITKQAPTIIYSNKSHLSMNDYSNHQITKEISGEITPIRNSHYSKTMNFSEYTRNEELREKDQLQSTNSRQNWNKTENYFKRNSLVDPSIISSSSNLKNKIDSAKPSVYSIPSFNMVRNKNNYTIDNNEGSFLNTTKSNNNKSSQYSIYEPKHQQGYVKKHKEDISLKKDSHDNSSLNYTNYQYENSKQKDYNEPQKEYYIDDDNNNNSHPTMKNTNSYCKDLFPKSYAKSPLINQSDSNMLCDQRYNVNQMKLDDLRYKYQLNDFDQSTQRGEKLAKYAIGDYYYKKKFTNN